MREYYRSMGINTINDIGGTSITGFQSVDGKISAGDDNAALLSFFGRINYDYKNRYLLSASIRRDESSKFAASLTFIRFRSFLYQRQEDARHQ